MHGIYQKDSGAFWNSCFHKPLMHIFVLIKIIWKNSYSDFDKGFIGLSVYVWYDHI